MDTDRKVNLNQIIDRHEHAIELEINKSMTSFESLGFDLNRENVCRFLDALSSRMAESCRKFELTYLASMNTFQLINKLHSRGDVTCTPHADNGQHSEMVTVDEDALNKSKDDAQSSRLDVIQTDQNKSSDNTLENRPIEKDLDVESAENMVMTSKATEDKTVSAAAQVTHARNGSNSSSLSSVSNATAAEEAVIPSMVNNDTTVAADSKQNDHQLQHGNPSNASGIADGIDEILQKTNASEANDIIPIDGTTENVDADDAEDSNENSSPTNQGKQVTMDDDQTAGTDDKDKNTIEMPQSGVPPCGISTIIENNDKDSSMETDESALYIDTSVVKIDDNDDVSMTDTHSESAEKTNEKKIYGVETTAIGNTNAVVNINESEREIERETPSPRYASLIQSQASTPSPNSIDQIESTHQQEDSDYNAKTAIKLNSIKQQDPSKQESSHQEPAEKELTQQNHFKQTSSEQESSPHQHETSEEAKDLIYENAAATEMINSSLKRKNSDKLDTICPGAKKHKRKKAVPKNTNPDIHCRNRTYNERCLICRSIESPLTKHYREAHPDSDVYISRPTPGMIKKINERNDYTSLVKNGEISAFCFFCKEIYMKSEIEWRNHLLSHTGELQFYCNECGTQSAEKVQHGNCSIVNTTSAFDTIDTDTPFNSLMSGYMCKLCNYTQMHEAHITLHLKREHSALLYGIDVDRNIATVPFIPDLRPIMWDISSRYEFVPETKRFRCGYPQCATIIFRDSVNLTTHLNDCHKNEEANFKCPHCKEKIKTLNYFDVTQHFEWHGNFLAECCICKQQCEGSNAILNHIIAEHRKDHIRYRSTYIKNKSCISKRECFIWLECKVCHVRVKSVAEAMQHFMLKHISHSMDFDAIKMIKETTDGVTTCFKLKDRVAFNCGRSMVCNECDHQINRKSELLQHFNDNHSNSPIAVHPTPIYINESHPNRPSKDYLNFSDNLVFYCAHCHDNRLTSDSSSDRDLAYNTMTDVYTHWKHIHSLITESKPFRFYAIEFVLCLHCKFIGSFAAVKKHSKENHPNKLLAISRVHDANACTLCPYVGNALDQHIKRDHELILRNDTINPTHFTDATLARLFNEFLRTKYKCLHCGQVFETKALAQAHNAMQHSSEPLECIEYIDNKIQLIAGCCGAQLELQEFVGHWADPNNQVNEHANSIAQFWSTKVIFGNGLVMNKHNLLGTKYDDSKQFEFH